MHPRFEPRLVKFRGITGIKLGVAIELLLETRHPTRVALYGPTSYLAVDWIKQELPENSEIRWERQPALGEPYCFTVSPVPYIPVCALSLYLAALDQDDVIRFLLEHSPKACQSVIARLKPQHYQSIGSDLCIWCSLLPLLARDEGLTVEQALWNLFQAEMDEFLIQRNPKQRQRPSERYSDLLKSDPPQYYQRMWALQSIPSNIMRLSVEDVVHRLWDNNGGVLATPLERDVIIEVSQRLKNEPKMVEYLRSLTGNYTASMATSILHQMQMQWKPTTFYRSNLSSSQYDKAEWPKVWFTKSDLICCNFSESILTEASLSQSKIYRCDFANSNLDGITSFETAFKNCDFTASQLSRSTWKNSNVSKCDFIESNLDQSTMENVQFSSSDFQRACLAKARLENCYFEDCSFDDSDLNSLNAKSTIFVRCRLKQANLTAAEFTNCNFAELDIEDTLQYSLDFETCSLGDSTMTGSKLFDCSFANSDLKGSKMAEIEWHGCDLRGADLRKIVFHFGSTRCGLVGSPYPSHGTRTGFYTDQLEEQYFREPQEIRRAALINCDLRGANLDGVDFYLVDLTGSVLDRHRYKQAIATGALGIG